MICTAQSQTVRFLDLVQGRALVVIYWPRIRKAVPRRRPNCLDGLHMHLYSISDQSSQHNCHVPPTAFFAALPCLITIPSPRSLQRLDVHKSPARLHMGSAPYQQRHDNCLTAFLLRLPAASLPGQKSRVGMRVETNACSVRPSSGRRQYTNVHERTYPRRPCPQHPCIASLHGIASQTCPSERAIRHRSCQPQCSSLSLRTHLTSPSPVNHLGSPW